MQNLISLNSLQGEAFGLLGKADGYKVLKCPTCEEIFAVRIDVENMKCPHCSHQSIKTQNCDYSSAIFKHDEKYRKLMDAKKISLIAFLILLVLAVVCVDSGAMSFITGLLSSIALISWLGFIGAVANCRAPQIFRQEVDAAMNRNISFAINEAKEKEYRKDSGNLANRPKEVVSTFSGHSFYVYKENDNLIFFPVINNFMNSDVIIKSEKEVVPIKLIDFFEQGGDIRHEMQISGGNSGVGGAALGYWLAGPLGAALMANPTEIQSQDVAHDERCIRIQYTKGGRTTQLLFPLENYAVFKMLIPEKERAQKVENVKGTTAPNISTSDNDVFATLKKLSELKEQGILTEDEFNKKKEELLKNIK